MQTAQKVITAYRRKRIIVCLLVALLTLGTTLAIRFISQRSVNEEYIRTAASQRVTALDNILRPLSAERATLLSLVDKPCMDIHLTLRKMAASLQTVRSVALVASGMIYCSSIFGQRQADLHQLQPALPARHPLLLFSTDNSLLKGTPVLIQWYPASESGFDGVMLIVNIELLGTLILKEKSPLISDVSLQVGDHYFISGLGLIDKAHAPQASVIYRQRSTEFPFTININGPGAATIALEELPSPAIAQAIAERAADIGIVADHADLRGLASYPFRQDRLVLALPPGHALSGRRQLSFADALPFDFIGLPEQSALQQHLEQLAIRSGGPMRLRARAANFDAICRMVLRGAGLAVVPEESARRLPEILRNALPLTDDWAIRRLSIVVRERAQLPLPAQRLVAFLRQEEDGITGAR